jgi:hypothetical protein
MLEDVQRLQKFKEAIFQTVRPGDVVIDLGTGTGILAIWAAQAGARKVYAIEETDTADIAAAVVLENGWEKIVSVIKANSTEVSLPELADVLIAELVGHFFFEEGIIEYVSDVRDKFLKASARIIPAGVKVYIAPAELGEHFQEISFWKNWSDPKLSAVCRKAANTAYVEGVNKDQLLAREAAVFNLRSSTWKREHRKAECEFVIERSGKLDALAGWFELSLTGETTLGTAPYDPPTHWKQCVFPLNQPIAVSAGDPLHCRIAIEPFGPGCRWHWSLTAVSGDKPREEVHEFEITYGVGSRLITERF